jgi:hypothetical protein
MAIAKAFIRGTWFLAVAATSCGGSNHLTVLPDSGLGGSPAQPKSEDAGSPEYPDLADAAAETEREGSPGTAFDAADTATAPDAGDMAEGAVPDAGVDLPVVVGCKSDLSGAAPFGSSLSGTASFAGSFSFSTSAPITSTMNVQVYFAAGRVAGAPVQLAMQSRVVAGQYFFGPQVTLASDLSASGLTVGGHDMQVTGDLLPGAGGLQATVAANFSEPGTDVADDRTATMLMCPSGDVPAPALGIGLVVASPLSTFAVNSATPLSADALRNLRITSSLGALQIAVSPNSYVSSSRYASGPNFKVAATSAFPPGQPLSFDASEMRDVLGRAVPLTLSGTQVLTTTNVLGDLTFATTPPTGTIACSGCSTSVPSSLDAGTPTGMSKCTGGGTIANGVLTIKGGPFTGRDVDALMALPSTTATKLRVRMAIGDVIDAGSQCLGGSMSASMQSAAMAIVGPNGEIGSRIDLMCDGGMVDHILDLPSASPLWLTIHVEGSLATPYSMPVPGPPSVNIDELELM